MKNSYDVSGYTLDLEIVDGNAFVLVQGSIYPFSPDYEAVHFSIENRARSGEHLNLVPVVRVPPLSGEGIKTGLKAADLAHEQCALYKGLIKLVMDGELSILARHLIQKEQWTKAAEVLALGHIVPGAITGEVATQVLTELKTAVMVDGAMDSRKRLLCRIGKHLLLQVKLLVPHASEAIVKQCVAYQEFRDQA
jgi:hypothetical protein